MVRLRRQGPDEWGVATSGRNAFVVMVKTDNLRNLDHGPTMDGVGFPRLEAVHIEGVTAFLVF
ncbi:MAG: hypothetical protein KAY32_14730 [Candidatus Eisenbacteria sp.]|nr:hypothetical protein [Candidatus Eisenbacteria bacterium]